jgi:DNA-binding beta-propeller fold protein YncE|nr:hypothetical protein [Kofleriaceae bacterium]
MTKAIVFVAVAAVACGGSPSHGGSPDAPSGGDDDAAPPHDAGTCARTAPTGDHAHRVVISHPFDGSGNPATAWEVLALSGSGELSEPGVTFQMGVESEGAVVFTPDGALGLAPQDDGSVGVFALADDGTPTVLDAAFTGSSGMYADRIVMDPAGDHAYVLDQQTRDNGGGVYRIDLACDGTPSGGDLVVAATLPGGLAFVPGGDRALLAAGDVGSNSGSGNDTQLVQWSETGVPSFVGGANAFGDGMAIVGGTALTADGSAFLIGDINQFETGEGSNRIAVVTRDGDTLAPAGVLPIDDPEALVASPFGDVVLATSGFGNAVEVLDTSGSGGAWTVRGEPTYTGAKPELPGAAVEVTIGAIAALVLVSELEGVRRVELRSDGHVVDDGRFTIGDGTGNDLAAIVGAIGVTP